MRASISHWLTPPSNIGIGIKNGRDTTAATSLKDRIVQSTAPLRSDNDDDNLLLSGCGPENGSLGDNMNANGHNNSNINNQSNHSGANAGNRVAAFLDRSISIVEVHPTEPILCYVDYQHSHLDSDDTNKAGIKGLGRKKKVKSPIHQRIVVHNFIQNQVVSEISLLSIVQQWIHANEIGDGNDFTKQKKKTIAEQQAILHQTCVNLGYITSIQFMDKQVLFYNSGKSHHLDPSHDSYNAMPYLVLKFPKGILIYHHNGYVNVNSNASVGRTTIIPNKNTTMSSQGLPFSPVMDITQSKLNSATPTSKPTPILSTNLLAIGCSDGAMRFFSLVERRVVKSVRGPNGRNDPVVGIVSVNIWSDKDNHARSGTKNHNLGTSSGVATGSNGRGTGGNILRIATVCSSGSAYVWELQVEFNRIRIHSTSKTSSSPSTTPKQSMTETNANGLSPNRKKAGSSSYVPHLQSFKIRPPLVKLDPYYSTQHICSNSDSSNSLLSPTNTSSKSSKWSKRDRFKISFDPDKQMLYWAIQFGSSPDTSTSASNISGGSGPAGRTVVAVWEWNDLALFHATTSVNRERHTSEVGNETPIYCPCNLFQIPILEGHGHGYDVPPSLSNVLPGLVHPSFSEIAIMSLVVSGNGCLHLIGAKRNENVYDNSVSSMSASAATSKNVPSLPLKLEKAAVYHTFTLKSLQKSARGDALFILKLMEDGKVKVTSVTVSKSRPDWVILMTNVGIMLLNLVTDEEILLTGSPHVMFPAGRGISNGLVSVEDSSVFVSLISDPGSVTSFGINASGGHTTPSIPPSLQKMSSIGKVWLKNKTLVYKSPKPLHKSLDFQSRPVRSPPRLLLSPSGKFLCLFWHYENRYEILHMDSLTDAIRKPNRDGSATTDFSPAVDTGFDVLSFAWVGNEDSFALLCPPELVKEDNAKVVKTRTTINILGPLNSEQDDGLVENIAHDPAKFKPRVELKVLVGVNADANEFSSSIAAATATYLGSITLRGRHAPTCLFGGPVLCVGSFTKDKDTEQRDGIAYFYSLRPSAKDDRASSYSSVGPALPYPDLVAWDDEGGLCALIVGRRIAIYRSYSPYFTLVGTSHLGCKMDFEPVKVQSAKFIHGVLYCSTEKSIQCIFLGDLDKKEQVCYIDNFVLATIEPTIIPSHSINSPIPSQIQMSLLWPSILGYHQGVLLISSNNGAHGVSLDQSLLRIGALLAAGQTGKAQKWIESIHPSQHEYLARFLSRRGSPDLAIQLSGLSMQSAVHLCSKYGLRGHLETLTKQYCCGTEKLISSPHEGCQ